MQVEVEFEGIPPMCSKRKSFGHVEFQCTNKQLWMPIGDPILRDTQEECP